MCIRDRSGNRALFALLAGGVAGVARRLAFGFERDLPGGGFFLLAHRLDGGLGRGFRLAKLLLGLGGLARQFGLGARGRQGRAEASRGGSRGRGRRPGGAREGRSRRQGGRARSRTQGGARRPLRRPQEAQIARGSRTCLLYTSPSPRDRTRSRM